MREWKLLRWPTGLLAAAGVFGVTTRALGQTPLDPPTVAWLMQAALVIGYFASIAVRTLGRQVIAFEVVQTVLVLLVGVGGALAVSRSAGSGGSSSAPASLSSARWPTSCRSPSCRGIPPAR